MKKYNILKVDMLVDVVEGKGVYTELYVNADEILAFLITSKGVDGIDDEGDNDAIDDDTINITLPGHIYTIKYEDKLIEFLTKKFINNLL